MRFLAALVLACVLGASPDVLARSTPDAAAKDREALSVTHHTKMIGGREIAYTATAGYLTLPDYEGKPRARMFYIAYTRTGVDNPAERPLTFSFNGGPGSSSVWLHLGALGPRRVDMGPEGFDQRPPFALVDNEHAWLDLTDLVFIDPVTTGYSRPVEGVRGSEFHGVRQDTQAVGDFIRLWTTREARWASPKFLVGESYGTTRAASLSGYLQETHGMYLNGILLISPILNFQTARFDVGNDEPFWNFLPTYTATAFYHGRLEPALQRNLEATLEEARRWASTDYLLALSKGDRLTPRERTEIARALSRYTGLSPEFCERSNLRISIFNFTKELLRAERRTVGRLDSRFKGIDRLAIGNNPEWDPSMIAIEGPYTAALNDYVRRELGFESDLPYEILTGRVQPWSYGDYENRYANLAETMRRAMSKNPSLKVLWACGYYDLATPFFAAEQTAAQMQLDPELRGNMEFHYYESGHMMYIRRHDLEKLKIDIAGFYSRALEAARTP
ncbi:MAG: hypothetical protein KF866_10705 [Phycisphaeraceae bacterium]|nr:hypothetical protein [Phycisphaeraceae bacterium]